MPSLLNGSNPGQSGTRKSVLRGTTKPSASDADSVSIVGQPVGQRVLFRDHPIYENVNRIRCQPRNSARFVLPIADVLTPAENAIRDGLLALISFMTARLNKFFIAREDFWNSGYFCGIAAGCFAGRGVYDYEIALRAESRLLSEEK